MRKDLLPREGQFYRANLHCHSTFSDGHLTPAELKKIYMDAGYSVVAFTDHDVFIPHQELTDDRFLALNGFEVEVDETAAQAGDMAFRKCFHACFVALDPENLNHPLWHRSKYLFGPAKKYRDLVRYDESKPDYERFYTPECLSDMMRIGRENGFFVTYNHPAWSMETGRDYTRYENMNAMEISNYSSLAEGYEENCAYAYDELLRSGKRIFCISADDNHNHADPDSRFWDSFGGYIQIKAPRLDYKTIAAALTAGNFYASQGPEIQALWFEDGQIHVRCAAADRITANYGIRKAKACYAPEGGVLTEAAFDVRPEDRYVRVTVYDAAGRRADTNAYFTDTLFEA